MGCGVLTLQGDLPSSKPYVPTSASTVPSGGGGPQLCPALIYCPGDAGEICSRLVDVVKLISIEGVYDSPIYMIIVYFYEENVIPVSQKSTHDAVSSSSLFCLSRKRRGGGDATGHARQFTKNLFTLWRRRHRPR